ncbi:MAG: ATP-binding protein [Planctomycetota bacterium]
MSETKSATKSTQAERPSRVDRAPSGLLAGLRIRKKLILLHTIFSLGLAALLLVALRPALREIVRTAEEVRAIELVRDSSITSASGDLAVRTGTAVELGLSDEVIREIGRANAEPVTFAAASGATAVALPSGPERYRVAEVVMPGARAAVGRVYGLLVLALLAVYALVAIALEVFVLPQHVYGPIRRMLLADEAVQRGERGRELIDPAMIPRDELGQIMKSRNASIELMRKKEAELAAAFEQIEAVAGDLKRKNHLLENARRNLEGADRLASLGMMSAGIAHELNTPLAVAKGLVEKLRQGTLTDRERDLLGRVIGRLEKLSESLLDFARAREPNFREVDLRTVVEEARMLVALDRGVDTAVIENAVGEDVGLKGDADRLVQVFVNLIRNAVDSSAGAGSPARVRVESEGIERDGASWLSVRVLDEGPGIDPGLIPTLFEPFVSTRLDAKGTGLGLAVADGIVREHSGTIIAGNRTDRSGAVLEVLLPCRSAAEPAGGQGEVLGDARATEDGAA